MAESFRLPGGHDQGAVRLGGRVRRIAGPWTPSVHHLLAFLADEDFVGAPQPLGIDLDSAVPTAELTYLDGETVGDRRPWPSWVHCDATLRQVASWLSAYHRVVEHYHPPADAIWREEHAPPGPGVLIAHNDAAPYNAVWKHDRLVGFVDWDMAGPRHREDDLAWTAFSWVPLHAEHVVAAEGFTDFGRRRERLAIFLDGYGSPIGPDEVLRRLGGLLEAQAVLIAYRADAGDDTYRRMLDAGRADDLLTAMGQFRTV